MAALSETALVHHHDEALTSTARALSTDIQEAEREAAAFELRRAFCAQIKNARERRGVSLHTIAVSTKISESLFTELERGDLARWPTGIYRRAFFREYAAFVGLPVESMVSEFVRLFPEDVEQVTSELRVPGPLRLTLARPFWRHIAPMYAELAAHRGDSAEAARALKTSETMAATVLKHGWDGEWFLRAYDFFGNKVGSKECEEGQIFIEPQGYCVMAGIGKDSGHAKKALDAVKERLDTPYGVVLVNPAYTKYHLELGEISSYPPGYKENAGIFCHNNPWIMIAETVVGRPERAFDYYKKISPAYIEEISDLHRMEPYVYSQMIAGKDAAKPGEAKNSWLTGTAAWNFVAVSQYLLGVRPEYDGLVVQPCLPVEVPEFTVSRWARGSTYVIKVKNSGKGGAPKLVVDGKPVDGNLVPYAPKGKTVQVECTV